MTISRRRFLGSAAAISLGFTGLRCAGSDASAVASASSGRFGPLLDDPDGIIALPEGFSYRIVSRWRERMSDGFYVPSRHDGMGAFPGPNGTTLLVRNHEVTPGDDTEAGPFGADLELLERLDPSLIYDVGTGDRPALGGTTTLVFDTRSQTLVSHHLRAGGMTAR